MLVNESIFKKHVTVTSSFDYKNQIEPIVASIQNSKIISIFGSEYITELDRRFVNDNPITDEENAVIVFLQMAISCFAALSELPKFLVNIGGAGASQSETGNKRPIFEWQKLELENMLSEKAWTGIENAIIYSSMYRDGYHFDKWRESSFERKAFSMFINSAVDFNEFYPISSSRRTFEALKSIIKEVELFIIKPVIGNELYNSIISANQNRQVLSDDILKANQYACYALANYVISKAIYKLEFKFDEEGARVVSTPASGAEKVKVKNVASSETKREVFESCQSTAIKYLQELKEFLVESGLYIPESPEAIDNSTGSTVII